MGTYLMMLYVSMDQERAVKHLFQNEGWKYSKLDLVKTTNQLGPLVPQTANYSVSEQELSELRNRGKRKQSAGISSPNRIKQEVSPSSKRAKLVDRSPARSTRSRRKSEFLDEENVKLELNDDDDDDVINMDLDYGDDDDDFEDNWTDDVVSTVKKQRGVKKSKSSRKVIDLRHFDSSKQDMPADTASCSLDGSQKTDGTDVAGRNDDTVRLMKSTGKNRLVDEGPGLNTSCDSQSSIRRSSRARKQTKKIIDSPFASVIKPPTVAVNEEKLSNTIASVASGHTNFLLESSEKISLNHENETQVNEQSGDESDRDYDSDDDYADESNDYIELLNNENQSDILHGDSLKEEKEEYNSIWVVRRQRGNENSVYKCNQCVKVCGTLGSLKAHEQSIHLVKFPEEKAFPCKICGHKYPFEHHLHMHMLDKHGVIDPNNIQPFFVCDICGKEFYQQRSYDSHRKSHEEKDKEMSKFVCEYCGRNFNRSDVLKWHRNVVHLGIKRPRRPTSQLPKKYKCDQCDRSFKRRQHMEDHVGARHKKTDLKYKCDKCSDSFIRPHFLQYHVNKVHLNQKPHRCTLCGLGFYSSVSLRKHFIVCSKSEEKMHRCEHCGRLFPTVGNLSMHVEAMHSTNPLTCECGVIVKWRSSMTKHKRRCALNPDNRKANMTVVKPEPYQDENFASGTTEVQSLQRKPKVLKQNKSATVIDLPVGSLNSNLAGITETVIETLNEASGSGDILGGGLGDTDRTKWIDEKGTEIPEDAIEILKGNEIQVEGTVQYDVSSIIEGKDDDKNVYYVILKE